MSIIAEAFREDAVLQSRVLSAASDPAQEPLLAEISHHVLGLKRNIHELKRKLDEITSSTGDEPPEKKRKLPTAAVLDVKQGTNAGWTSAAASLEADDLSFAAPVRKKLRLEVVPANGAPNSGGIRGRNAATSEIEVAMTWEDVEEIMCVPLPEKAQKSFNFVIIPRPTAPASVDGIVFNVPATTAKNIRLINGQGVQGEETYEEVIRGAIDAELRHMDKQVLIPEVNEFQSSIVQAHRKGEKAWHVKAWRRSKDEGFLYFLRCGILFGFRKPLHFFPLSVIDSISYTSVLQRTFNLNVAATWPSSEGSKHEEIEFAMLDQADFAGIDAYVKRHGLHDASLAESRRAQRYNVNPPAQPVAVDTEASHAANGSVAEQGHGEEEESELARAERELQDREDEEEEDYEASGGSSDGSGESSGEEDAGEGNGEVEYAEEEEEDEEY